MPFEIPIYTVELKHSADLTWKDQPTVLDAAGAEPIFRAFIGSPDREVVAVMMLDADYRLIGLHLASIGDLTAVFSNAREIFKAAILLNASYIVLAHNHPQGDPEPSDVDISTSKSIMLSGVLLGIPVLDDLVLGHDAFVSLVRDGYIA